LNFIDWDNEWERVFEYNYYNPVYECPIEGMDIHTFEQIYVSLVGTNGDFRTSTWPKRSRSNSASRKTC